MLFPQANPYRQLVDLSGFWELRFDPDDQGEQAGWGNGFSDSQPVAVPASWNDQFAEWRDYLGPTWYQTRFDLPWGWEPPQKQLTVRFGSVNYLAKVWLNGRYLGEHEGGHLPFAFAISQHVQPENNLLVVRVEGILAPDRVPPGNPPRDARHMFMNQSQNFPPASFDFFPFCGIQRPVLLTATAATAVTDLTVTTKLPGQVQVQAKLTQAVATTVRFSVGGTSVQAETPVEGDTAECSFIITDAILWSPETPHLYDLTVEVVQDGAVTDRYTLPIGIREIKVEGDALLLNGRPIYLTGFGRHIDFPVTGRGFVPAVIVKDYALMKWIGANSFRTTHYPYSEEMMRLADRLGFLVIDETPAVGLFFAKKGLKRRLQLCRQYVEELISRDKNHPSVIMWSIANEPHSSPATAVPFLRNLYDLCKELDPMRPVTLTTYRGVDEESFAFCDVMSLNRYAGWYSESGRLDEGVASLTDEIDAMYAKFKKPLILSEFGADTVAGHHAHPPEMFSEEYQAAILEQYIDVLRRKPFVVGEHVWNMCDFKTSQGVLRVGAMNLKGVFTRDRRPKLAAHRLRALWRADAGSNH
ncbi:MAG: beta-glucuronidase [Ardenticatenaceae bacterium]|nr:beta-glucuronidase [Ardenticatenaceae bacterium]